MVIFFLSLLINERISVLSLSFTMSLKLSFKAFRQPLLKLCFFRFNSVCRERKRWGGKGRRGSERDSYNIQYKLTWGDIRLIWYIKPGIVNMSLMKWIKYFELNPLIDSNLKPTEACIVFLVNLILGWANPLISMSYK